MKARDQTVFEGKPHVVRSRVIRGQVGAPDAHSHGDQGVIAGEPTVAEAFHLGFGMQILFRRDASFTEPRLWRTVPEQRSNAGFYQRINGAVAMTRRRIVVAPVEQRRYTAIKLIEGADKIG